MRNFNQLYLVNIFLFFFSTSSFADIKTGYIDLDLILAKSIPSKILFSELKINEEKELQNLNKKEIDLKNEEKNILSKKNIVSEEEYNKSVSSFKKKINNYNNEKKIVIENLKQIRNKEIIRFFNLINPIIEKTMEKDSIEILFEKKNIYIAKSSYDITQIVIENINNEIKDFKMQE
ncbi:OmpH family outer membrane protein [Candidatus Pelagibacter sp.]|nr:OmpH family outer membrane protein [Candidatus Pelagibacter sp.]